MNWSHALLVVSFASYVASWASIMVAIDERWVGYFFIIGTISGALAAGLWN